MIPGRRFATFALCLAFAAPLAAEGPFDPLAPGWGSPPAGPAAESSRAYPLGETREVRGPLGWDSRAPVESVLAVYEEGRLTRVLVAFQGEGPFQALSRELEHRLGGPGTERAAPPPASRVLSWRSGALWADLYLSGEKAPGGLVLSQAPPGDAPDAERRARRGDVADRLWVCRLVSRHLEEQLKSVDSLIGSLERSSDVFSPVPEDPSCFGAAREAQGEQIKNKHTQLVALRQQMQQAAVRLGRLEEELQAALAVPGP